MAQEIKKWQVPSSLPEKQRVFVQQLNISSLTAQILLNRGISSVEEAKKFLKPSLTELFDPFLLPDMDRAVQRILIALQKKEGLGIFGDYDVDGLSSTALLIHFFREIGVRAIPYIPDRVKDGYGVSQKGLAALKKQGTSLVITVDCGSKSNSELKFAKEIGLDVIVTDHHGMDEMPSAVAIVNPQRGNIGKELCGAGVAFFLLLALRQKLRGTGLLPQKEPNLKKHLDLVTLATVADMVPLTGVNRTLVFFGLQELARTEKLGLIALKEISGLKPEEMKTHDIGFRLGPRLNAGGRIAQPGLGLELLVTENPEKAKSLAAILEQCNSDRQVLQENHVKEALVQAEEKGETHCYLVHSEQWHPGIIGLVASKLVEKYFRPAIAFAREGKMLRGSARSIPGIHITELLAKTSEHLEKFGGHAQAAGLTLQMEKLPAFEAALQTLIQQEGATALSPTLSLDAEVALNEINPLLVNELEGLRPFGIGNPEPLFACRNLKIKEARIVGKNHLKLRVSDNAITMDGIVFGVGEVPSQAQADIAFVPQWNTFQETTKIQLKIKDLKSIDSTTVPPLES